MPDAGFASSTGAAGATVLIAVLLLIVVGSIAAFVLTVVLPS
jgi:hypothetical protein